MRLMPQREAMSPQWRTSFSMTGSRFISVFTEISRNGSEVKGACEDQAVEWWSNGKNGKKGKNGAHLTFVEPSS
jgi:hypothetical protein